MSSDAPKIVRALQEKNFEVPMERINRLAKGAWGAVSSILWSIFRDQNNDFQSGFIGDACKPVAPGGSSSINLQPGLAPVWDKGEGDDFLSQLKPIYLREAQTVGFTENTDPSGDDRIDSVFIRPVEVEREDQLQYYKDPDTETWGQKKAPRRVAWEFETKVEEGQPASNPSAPSSPPGNWLRVADVTRPANQSNVLSGDVNDQRTPADPLFSNLGLRDTLTLAADLVFKDPSSSDELRLTPDLGAATLKLLDDAANLGLFKVNTLLTEFIELYNTDTLEILGDNQTYGDLAYQHRDTSPVGVDPLFDPGDGLKGTKTLRQDGAGPINVQNSGGTSGGGGFTMKEIAAKNNELEGWDENANIKGKAVTRFQNHPCIIVRVEWDGSGWNLNHVIGPLGISGFDNQSTGKYEIDFDENLSDSQPLNAHADFVSPLTTDVPSGYSYVAANGYWADDGSGNVRVGFKVAGHNDSNTDFEATDPATGAIIQITAFYKYA